MKLLCCLLVFQGIHLLPVGNRVNFQELHQCIYVLMLKITIAFILSSGDSPALIGQEGQMQLIHIHISELKSYSYCVYCEKTNPVL